MNHAILRNIGFMEKMSKLFGELSKPTPEPKTPATPRATFLRLKKFRQTRQDSFKDSDFDIDIKETESANLATDTGTQGIVQFMSPGNLLEEFGKELENFLIGWCMINL